MHRFDEHHPEFAGFLDDPARAQRILDEVGAAFDIVDHLASRDMRRIS